MDDDDTVCIGFRRFSDDIALMIGHKPNYYWIVRWVALTPLMVAVRCGTSRRPLALPSFRTFTAVTYY